MQVKKRKFVILSVIILLVMGVRFVFLQSGYRESERKTSQNFMKTCPRYEMNVAFYPEEKKTDVFQTITITNDKAIEFKELYFHLYPNAFKTFDQVPFPREEMERAYPEGFAPGYITLKKLLVESRQANYEIEDTLLKIILEEPLKPGKKTDLTFEFELVIPPSHGRFGYGQNTFNIANWYPILAMYNEKGWHKDPYYSVGDPFFSEAGLYEVHIKAPKDYTIAASGSLQGKHEDEEQVIWSFNTGLVRDFAWIAGENLEIKEISRGGTRIISYYPGDKEVYGGKALEHAKNALFFFNDYFGQYPYDEYCVVASDFYIGGMEYPNLVMIGVEFYGSGEFLEYVVVHETAHQWWYGLVGNNQIEEAWLDEALAEYSTLLYYEYFYGRKTGQEVYEEAIFNPYKLYEVSSAPGPILRPLSDFTDWKDYSAAVYYKGAIMLKELEGRMGKKKLQEALRYYFKKNLFKNATAADFIEALNHVTGVDWTDYILDWLKRTEALDKAA
jgi:hypothetical protein